jgi:alpha-glucosidase
LHPGAIGVLQYNKEDMFFIIVGFQSALIYFHQFSPFERECNWRAVAQGARPAPRFWAVALLDLCTALLLGLLALTALPAAPGWTTLARLEWMTMAGAILAGVFAAVHYWVNDALVYFPDPWKTVRRLAAALAFGAVLSGGALLAAAFLAGSGSRALLIVVQNIFPIFLLGLMVFLAQALAFPLRVIPLIGPVLHAGASTGLWQWWIQSVGDTVVRTLTGVARPGLSGLEGLAAGIVAAGVLALLAAWRLAGPSGHADGVEPPSLIESTPLETPVDIAVTDTGGSLSTASLRVQISRAPFCLTVSRVTGERLMEISEHSIQREILLHKIVSIPILYTGNTFKMKWRAASREISALINIQADTNALCMNFLNGRVRVAFHGQDVLRLTIEGKRSRFFNALSLTCPIPADCHLLGFGQRFNRVDQRGGELDFLVEEGGVGYAGLAPLLKHIWGERGTFPNGEYCTSFPAPFALVERESGGATGLFWNSYRPSWFKSDPPGSAAPEAHLTVLDQRLDLFLCCGSAPLDVIDQYTELSGRPLAPPPWVLLPWKTRTGAMTAADVQEDIERYRALDIPLGQVGVENWQKVRGSYEFNPANYPDVTGLVRQAHTHGYRIQIWHFPYMNTGSRAYIEGIRSGYFLRNRLGLPYLQRIFRGIAAVIDYSNPATAHWHEKIVKSTIYERGFSGTMTDYGESIPPDCVFYNGQDGLALRNAYPVMYCRAMQHAAQESLGEDYLLYPRAGYAASQRYITAQFPGDQDTDWDAGDGLPAAVRAMLNASLCGLPVNGSDIGGWFDALTPITSKELFVRWAEVGAYSPLMRAHGGIFGRNREPWKFDDETVAIYRLLSQEHVRLFPYLYSLAIQASRTGQPIVLHPALLWPGQKELYLVEDSWMLGKALYIAPVLFQGAIQRKVILPPGDWWDLREDRPLHGPAQITVRAELGSTPRFLRRGHPLARFVDAFDTFDAGTQARVGHLNGDLEVWLYAGQPNVSFTLFDGTVLDCNTRPARAGEHAIHWKIFGKPT